MINLIIEELVQKETEILYVSWISINLLYKQINNHLYQFNKLKYDKYMINNVIKTKIYFEKYNRFNKITQIYWRK